MPQKPRQLLWGRLRELIISSIAVFSSRTVWKLRTRAEIGNITLLFISLKHMQTLCVASNQKLRSVTNFLANFGDRRFDRYFFRTCTNACQFSIISFILMISTFSGPLFWFPAKNSRRPSILAW